METATLDADERTDIGLIRVRPIRPEDAPALVAFHERLSPESQFLRFFNAHPHLSAAEVDRFTHVDGVRRLALVAELDGEIIAVARYDRVGDGPEAEVAFVVEDSYQCHGIGSMLLRRLAAAAAERGITRFTAETLPSNRRMQAVFRHHALGAKLEFEDGVITVRLPTR